MSEYQFYEFQAVDRRLTDDEMRALRQISTRATITPTNFINVYNYGDFRGNPAELIERFFDLHVYVANWGTNILMIRVPSTLLDLETARQYAPDEPALARSHGGHTIVELQSDMEEFFGWVEGDGWMDRLRAVRDELVAGDLRPLYLGWLMLVMWDEPDSEEPEPPVPPGLGELTPAQRALAEFLRIDDALIEVAAERSAPFEGHAPLEDELREWIAGLSTEAKDGLLVRAMLGEDALLGARLLKEFHEDQQAVTSGGNDAPARRTSGELFTAWQARVAARARENEARIARGHAIRMEQIAQRAEVLWQEADALAEARNSKSYAEAIEHLTALHEAAQHFGTSDEFERRRDALVAKHSRKSSFVEMARNVGTSRPSNGERHHWRLDLS